MNDVTDYLQGSFRAIEGWCIPQLWQTIQPLSRAVLEEGGKGPVAEIGVYHGKFFIGLVKTAGAPAANFAIDVYDLQQFNLDGAGKGNLDKFRQNMHAAGVADSQVEIVKTDSMWLNRCDIDRIRERSGGFSMFSVDGCHLAEHTINDLQFAAEVTLPQGLIFIDDYYNAQWPGVQEGVAKYFLMSAARFVPLAYSCNKLILCNLSYHGAYLKKLVPFVREHFADTRIKMVKRFGFDCANITPDIEKGAFCAKL